ncbi:nucleoside triphosphate pyrophosphohydrolase [Candidatus Pacearchaeota archaeon]|nr:nucleoside triphosphate pyrophosphohydrolase [Candidatus Pacearchaeota archaeon]
MVKEKSFVIKYDKLIRDKVPEIIEKDGKSAVIHRADPVEYWKKLKEKLQEEVDEFIKEESVSELSDIYEVLHAIVRTKRIDMRELDHARRKKRYEKGAFRKGIILDETRRS